MALTTEWVFPVTEQQEKDYETLKILILDGQWRPLGENAAMRGIELLSHLRAALEALQDELARAQESFRLEMARRAECEREIERLVTSQPEPLPEEAEACAIELYKAINHDDSVPERISTIVAAVKGESE